jgi:hypothetical protein
MKTRTSLGCLALAFSSLGSAGTPSEQYALSERCAKSALEWWSRAWGGESVHNTETGQIIASYTNHYNAKLNKCFIRENVAGVSRASENGRSSSTFSAQLLDVLDNKTIAAFWSSGGEQGVTSCFVGDVACKNRGEWESLAKTYMEG